MRFLIVLSFLALTPPSFAQSLEDGKKSFIEGEFKKAREILLALEKQADGEALTYLGHIYFEGKGIDKDVETACDYFEKAAKLHYAEAQTLTGLCYFVNTPGRPRQVKKAYNWMNKGYQNGNTENANLFAIVAYFVGRYEQAYKLALPFANADDAKAMNMIGTMYRDGLYVQKNLEQSCDWFEKSANAGFYGGMYHLAICFFHGEGRPQNKRTAFKYFQAAAKQGDEDAIQAVKDMKQLGFK